MKSSLVALGLAAAAASALPDRRYTRDGRLLQQQQQVRRPGTASNATACPVPVTEHTKASKPTPFQALTQGELDSVLQWLSDPARGLNLTDPKSEGLSQSDNYVWHIETLKPNKTDVLAYLDGNASAVPRHARVVINEGGRSDPRAAEYYVGPLPISDATTVQTLDFRYNGPNKGKAPFNGRFFDNARTAAVDAFVAGITSELADITNDLVGFAYYGQGDERSTGQTFYGNPASTDGSTGVLWLPFRRNGLAPYDQPSDLYVSVDVSGTDASLYKLRMIVYNLTVYSSVADFREAWAGGKVTKTPAPTTDESFLRKDRKGERRALEDRMAPTVVEPEGKRYKVDLANRYVEYMGWSFYTRFDRDVGIQFYDIKFGGERIMYELSLQDAVAQYAGNNPFQAGTAYMDRYYGIGAQTGRLIPGYDCPYHATYWDNSFTSGLDAVTANNSICIFETDTGTPVTRHTDASYMQSTKSSKLVVRQISTIGNYDYLWDYSFVVDGSLAVDAHASGYVQANYYRPDDEGRWGPRIQETISGTLHTHVMNFKADLDLVDSANTLVRTDIVVENVTQPWYPERGEFEMMRYNISSVASEGAAMQLPLPANGQSMYTVVNKARPNRWGEPRGYRIVPGLSNVHLPSQRSPFFLRSAQFAKQFLAVSRQHDTEPDASAALNQNLPEAPLVEFWRFFDDDEPLEQQDLVAWVNLGMHHYTRSEDIPNTLMTEAHSSIAFAPQNWGNTELTVDLANSIIYNAKSGVETVTPERNGVTEPACFLVSAQDELLGVFEGTSVPDPYKKNA